MDGGSWRSDSVYVAVFDCQRLVSGMAGGEGATGGGVEIKSVVIRVYKFYIKSFQKN